MALTPQYNDELIVLPESEVATPEPSKTWSIDFLNGTAGGFIDGREALRQFVLKTLLTKRYRYVIYSEDYGSEVSSLIGASMSRPFLESEIPRMIKDALEYDDRVESVDVKVELLKDQAFVTVTVEQVNGEAITEEVTINV